MTITISTEGGSRLATWSVYSSNVEKLVIPRIGETICVGGEYFVVVDVMYNIPYNLSGFSPEVIRIRVKNKEKNEQTKYE